MSNRRARGLAVAATIVLGFSTGGSAAAAQGSDPDPGVTNGVSADAQRMMLLVHGYGNADDGKDCNGGIWKEALEYFEQAGGHPRKSMTTIGYYKGDNPAEDGKAKCDAMIGDKSASNRRSIKTIARDLANYIHENSTPEHPVDIVAHSMGGLISRVAVLGTYDDWKGFPDNVFVEDIVTLGTPHQGVRGSCPEEDSKDCTQWNQMMPTENGGTGFIDRLHESEPGADDRGLDAPWASGIDWSLVGSEEDPTVAYRSAIDQGYVADQKYGFDEDRNNNGTQDCWSPYEVDHQTIRKLSGAGGYCLRYWHPWGDSGPHTTDNGWSPLKVAFKAATNEGKHDDLPR